mgnify:CR=1 FL=1
MEGLKPESEAISSCINFNVASTRVSVANIGLIVSSLLGCVEGGNGCIGGCTGGCGVGCIGSGSILGSGDGTVSGVGCGPIWNQKKKKKNKGFCDGDLTPR